MRIRKTLAKALGQLRPPASPPSEIWNLSSSSNTSACGSQGLYCQLNQSPWDVYPNHRFQRSAFKCFEGVKSLPNSKEEPKEISGDISEHEKDVEKVLIEEKPLLNKRVNAQSKNKKKVDEIIMCKKNDGRKWFCKRQAKLPHTFCEHHLTLSRSYKGYVPSGSGVGCKANNDKETKKLNSEYYYYSTVAPSGGKRRCIRNVNDGSNTMDVPVKMETKVQDGKKDGVEVLNHKEGSSSNSNEKFKTGAKRGRKPVKYRSLDSLPKVEPNSSTTEEMN